MVRPAGVGQLEAIARCRKSTGDTNETFNPPMVGRRRGRAGGTPRSFCPSDIVREMRPGRAFRMPRAPFAFDGVHRIAPAGDDEVHFPLLLVAPEMNPGHTGGDERVQHQVLPKRAAILRAQVVPPPRVADQPGVETEDLGLGDDLPASAGRNGRTR